MIPPELLNTITTGDARELAKRIPDGSVDLIFTDPPYIGDVLPLYAWLGVEAGRVLKPGGSLLCFFGTGFLADILPLLAAGGLSYRWLMDVKWAGLPIFYGRIAVAAQRCIWFEKGRAKPYEQIKDSWVISQNDKTGIRLFKDSESGWAGGKSDWSKNQEIVTKWTAALTRPGDVVLDPFCGTGTLPAACRQINRQYIAFEIDPDTAERARLRVAQTQPPLPGLEFEQAQMEGIA